MKIIYYTIVILLISCSSQPKKLPWKDQDFEDYLTSINVPFKVDEKTGKVSGIDGAKLYDKYNSDFMDNRTKKRLESNPYLKVNKVYVHYRSYDSFDIYVFGTNEQFSMKYNASVDGKKFELTPEGYVKTKQSVLISNYGDFEIKENIIKTRRYSKSPHAEWYDYVNGTVKNDTIFMTEAYQGKDTYSFKKHWAASRKKRDFKLIYQPNFKVWVTTTHGSTVLTSFVIEGEFSIK
jgi:hypothetical protein